MENRAHALAAGLFTLALGLALTAVGWWFTRADDSRMVPYLVTTSGSVTGLKIDAPVRYRGVDVGKVDAVELSREQPGAIVVRVLVDRDTPVGPATYAQLGYLGVTGLAFIALNDDGKPRTADAAKVASIPMRKSLMDSGEELITTVSGIADRLHAVLDDDFRARLKNTMANVERTTAHAAVIAAQLEPTAKQLPPLLAEARQTIQEGRGAVGDARGALGDVRSAITRADGLIANVDKFTLRLDSKLDALTATSEEIGGAARTLQLDTLPRINVVAEDLVRKTRTLDRVLQQISDQPQSLVFGAGEPAPGPGERGFNAPESRR